MEVQEARFLGLKSVKRNKHLGIGTSENSFHNFNKGNDLSVHFNIKNSD